MVLSSKWYLTVPFLTSKFFLMRGQQDKKEKCTKCGCYFKGKKLLRAHKNKSCNDSEKLPDVLQKALGLEKMNKNDSGLYQCVFMGCKDTIREWRRMRHHLETHHKDGHQLQTIQDVSMALKTPSITSGMVIHHFLLSQT